MKLRTALVISYVLAALFTSSAYADPAPQPAQTPSVDGTAGPPAPPVAAPAPGSIIAELRGLDKTTARVSGFDAPVGEIVHFGTLDIMVRDCRKRPPEEEPEVAAYLNIDETRPPQSQNDKPQLQHLFQGWMFASSPAVSALEHPVYDVWVIDCKTPSGSTAKSG